MDEMEKLNDGTGLSQTYLRSTQIIFEAELQRQVQKQPSIDARWSTKFEKLVEEDEKVTSELTDSQGNSIVVKSQYVVGCDGAGSRVRRHLKNRSLVGEHLPLKVYMVYFRSRDLGKLHRQGRFW